MQLSENHNILGTEVMDHLGLVAASIKESNLTNIIDKLVPVRENIAKTTHGERVAAMIMNGLGFIDTRLYIFPKFLENKPVEKLFRKGISHEDFNEFALARTLDAIHDYGETKFFSEIATKIALNYDLFDTTVNLDTTTLSLYGDYKEKDSLTSDTSEDLDSDAIPKFGYAKNKRNDLKQMILLIAKSGPANLPIHMEAHSGNASDKVTLEKAANRIKGFCDSLKKVDEFLFVADSAMYETCIKNGSKISWLSRVPATTNECKQLLKRDDIKWETIDENYKMYPHNPKLKDKKLRWVLFYSQEAYERETQTLSKQIKKEFELLSKQIWHFENQLFGCQKDLEQSLKMMSKSIKYHQLSHTIQIVNKHEKRGRPSANVSPSQVAYKAKISLSQNDEEIEATKKTKGRFVLASNELNESKLKNKDFLKEYKKQSGVESGFKFIKDNAFEVDSVFLKTPSRISALMCIMTLSLLIYNLMQYLFRKKMQEHKIEIPAQKKNTYTSKPSLKWIFRLFCGVSVLKVSMKGEVLGLIMNIDDVRRRLVQLLGGIACAIYDVQSDCKL